MRLFVTEYAHRSAEALTKMPVTRRIFVFSTGVGFVYVIACLDLVNVKIDDVFITLRYSRNLLAGHGAVFNPGEAVEGYSNPTWLFLVTGIAAVTGLTGHLALFYLSKILCAAFGALTIVVMYRMARLRGNGYFATGLLVSVLAVNPFLNTYNISGKETSLVTFLVALSFLLYLQWDKNGQSAYGVGFAIALGLLSISRPEAVMYPAAVFLGILVARRVGIGSGKKPPLTLSVISIAAAIFIASATFRLWYFGDVAPTTLYAKNSPSWVTVEDGARYGLLFLGLAVVPYVFVALGKRAQSFDRVLIPMMVVIAAQFAFAAYSGGDWMPSFRLLLPVLPLMIFLVVDQVDVSGASREKLMIGLVLATLVIGVSSFVQREYIGARYKPFSSGLDLEFEAYTPHYYSVAQKLHDIARPGQHVLVAEAGLIPYLNDDLYFNDLYGLLDEHIAKNVDGRHFTRVDNDHFFGSEYDYVVIITKRDKSTRRDSDGYSTGFMVVDAFLNDPRFSSRYAPVYQEKLGVIFGRVNTG